MCKRDRWEDWGISCEADPKHRKMVLEALGLEEGSKSLVTPGSKEDDKEQEDQGEKPEASAKEKTEFRSVAARVNYWL